VSMVVLLVGDNCRRSVQWEWCCVIVVELVGYWRGGGESCVVERSG